MNELKTFNNPEFGKIRAEEINGEAWFVGKDVALVLGYSNPRDAISKHVDAEDKGVANCDTLGGMQSLATINESGLYSLILSSKLPTAKKFKHWVTSDVLPSIRKHGAYATPTTIESIIADPDNGIKLLQALKEEQQKRKELQEQNDVMKPKALFADSVSASNTSILIGELAKLIRQNGHEIGQNRLFEWMRNNGYLISRKGVDYNMPTQKSMELGLLEIKERTIATSTGVRITKTTKVTGKGQIYFINKFKAMENQDGYDA